MNDNKQYERLYTDSEVLNESEAYIGQMMIEYTREITRLQAKIEALQSVTSYIKFKRNVTEDR